MRGSFGRIEVRDVRQGVRIVAGNGEVVVAETGGAAYVKTGFGGVQADRFGGGLTVDSGPATTSRS